MKLLLDTQIFILWDADSPHLARELRAAIANRRNQVYVSAASIWEIAIKRRLGKLDFDHPSVESISKNRFGPLLIVPEHAEHAGRLPRHHDDPFDRMLIAQAMLEGMVLATTDAAMRSYDVSTLGLH